MKKKLVERAKKVVATAHKYSEEIICVTILGCLVLHTLGYFIRAIKY